MRGRGSIKRSSEPSKRGALAERQVEKVASKTVEDCIHLELWAMEKPLVLAMLVCAARSSSPAKVDTEVCGLMAGTDLLLLRLV
mmetsp:Transcript_45807/g.119189  ORF Transcript_45807/g.119189 Transcript_45807/m.119189 type:complete len:84 (+) Transcript_45807:360-611(+)